MGLPSFARFKRWFAYAPASMVYPQPRFTSGVGFSPAQCPATTLTMKPPSVQSPFAQCRSCLHWRGVRRLLRGHCSSVVARTDSCANPLWLSSPSAIASFEESWQVATGPCCQQDLPDVISANLSSDAWSLTTAVPRSAHTCFFLRVFGLPQPGCGSASRFHPRNTTLRGAFFEAADISFLCSGLRVCSPPRSFLPLRLQPQGSRGFYVRAHRASLPPLAPDMLVARIQAIGDTGTFTPQDPQPCRLLPPVYASLCTSRCPAQNSGPSGSLPLSRETLAFSTSCRFIPAHGFPFWYPG